jgi:predicted HAD superfamily phosphohydrolase YqeG
MRSAYLTAGTLAQVARHVTELGAATALVDVEPLIAYWDTSRDELDRGLAATLGLLVDSGVSTVVFATNSARTPSAEPATTHLHVTYRAKAGKPLRTAAYRHLPRPGVVIGDQVATDGVLAWRLGYTFLRYTPTLPAVPLGPRLMRQLGRPLQPLLFHKQ